MVISSWENRESERRKTGCPRHNKMKLGLKSTLLQNANRILIFAIINVKLNKAIIICKN